LAETLVFEALRLLGLRSGTMANCSILSREMQRYLGKKLSPITLFRMLYPEKYGVKPYNYSLDLLREFVSLLDDRTVLNNRGSQFYNRNTIPEESALYKLLSRNLFKSDLDICLNFFEDLPMDHMALGWERHIIGKSLGDWFKTYKGTGFPLKKMKILLGLPKIRTYYFETYVDYNHGLVVYGHGMEQMLQLQGAGDLRLLKQSVEVADSKLVASAIFGYLMLHHFAFLSMDEARRNRYRSILRDSFIEEAAVIISHEAPFVYIRYIAYNCLEEYEQGSRIKKYHVEEWVDVLNRLFGRERPWDREFAAIILCDLLVVLNERRLLEFLLGELPSKPIYEEIAQPVYIRSMLYRALWNCKSAEKVMDIVYKPYALGDGETAYHQLLMDRAMSLFDREYLTAAEKQELISQTGFTRFGKGVTR
jgi:hypothetical protein